MNLARFDLILFLCWFGTSHAILNATNIQFFTQQQQVDDDFQGFSEEQQNFLEILIYETAAKHAGQTFLNDTESYKKAVRLLLKLSNALGTPNKEDFCREYTFFEKHIKSFYQQTIKGQFAIVNDKKLLHQLYGDDEDRADIAAMLSMVEVAKCSENVPSIHQVQQLMDTIEKVDFTLDQVYEENPILKNTTEHLLRTITLYLAIRNRATPAVEQYWDEVIKTSGKDVQWKWMEGTKNYKDIPPLLIEIDQFLSPDQSDSAAPFFGSFNEQPFRFDENRADDAMKDEL